MSDVAPEVAPAAEVAPEPPRETRVGVGLELGGDPRGGWGGPRLHASHHLVPGLSFGVDAAWAGATTDVAASGLGEVTARQRARGMAFATLHSGSGAVELAVSAGFGIAAQRARVERLDFVTGDLETRWRGFEPYFAAGTWIGLRAFVLDPMAIDLDVGLLASDEPKRIYATTGYRLVVLPFARAGLAVRFR